MAWKALGITLCLASASAQKHDSLVLLQQRAEKIEVEPIHFFLQSKLDRSARGTQPLRAERTKLSPQQRERTLQDIQNFIASSEEGFATLVLMGDSTMSGITTELMNMTSAPASFAGCIYELLYVSNDRARAVNYGCNKDCGGVPPGSDWFAGHKLTDTMTKVTVGRAMASTKVLHTKGCKSGGGLETYVFRTGPFKNLVVHHWGFLPEYTNFCWDDCMTEAMAALKPTAVLWNIGLHLLNHDFKPSVCSVRNSPTKPNCGDYKELVKTATRSMRASGIPSVIWKTTNWVCEDIQSEGFPQTKAALARWHDEGERPALEAKCRKQCPEYIKLALPCYEWFMDAHTTTRLFEESMAGIEEVSKEVNGGVHVLDAFSVTKKCCDKDCRRITDDGEHYTGLDSGLLMGLASILSGRTQNAWR